MLKELLFRYRVKKLDEMHIRQYLERQGYELIYINSTHGQNVLKALKLTEFDEIAFTYKCGKFKYVFLGDIQNEEDKQMILLHECGHIELNHQSVSRYNEAQAWAFAYNVKEIYNKTREFMNTLIVFMAIVSMAIRF